MNKELFRSAEKASTESKAKSSASTSFLTEEQLSELKRPLDESRIERRKAKFGEVQYLPTYDIINRANEIFGYGGWQREIKRLEKVYEEEVDGLYNVAYLCEYRIKIGDITHEDVGFGSAINYPDPTSANEKAVKTAVSDGLKRCWRAFGAQFGLSLYKTDKYIEEYQPQEPRKITENQLIRLRKDLGAYSLSEKDIVDYVNLKMGSSFEVLEDLPLKVARRAIERFAEEKEGFAKEIRSLVLREEKPF